MMLRFLPRLLKHRTRTATFPVPALSEVLAAHDFAYEGFSSSDHFRGNEEHRFSRGEMSFIFGFAYSMYGEDFIGVEVPSPDGSGARSSAYLSYFVDYALERNALRASGLTHDQSLAKCLAPHVEYIARVVAVARSHGRVIPLGSDKSEAANGHAEP